ncbi:hypothetical protein GL267_007235 [Acidithiobacillus ferrianus]|uniref:Uncharacterized protein n=2 Tax=Acidithiobacillus ferrianus TaxID=2678518 RepID=A0A845U4E0_9PROT|nr:hypothetical protein [Acidithiobacillus ferrianus]NDU42066.1 hypothetical protein [Acidithiobacillus ferrianus]
MNDEEENSRRQKAARLLQDILTPLQSSSPSDGSLGDEIMRDLKNMLLIVLAIVFFAACWLVVNP